VKGRLQQTAQARILYREVESVYDALQRVRSPAESLRNQASGAIQVLASPGPGHCMLPDALRRFRAAFPTVQVSLDLLSYGPMVEKMKTQQADLAVAMCPSQETSLRTSNLCASRLFCLLPADHPLRGTKTVTLGQLQHDPLIAFSRASAVAKIVTRRFREAGVVPNIAITVPFGTNTYNLVSAGIGIAIVDGFTASGAKAFGLHVHRFDCPEPLDVVILENRERPLTQKRGEFHRAAAAKRGGVRRRCSIDKLKRFRELDEFFVRPRAVLPHQDDELGGLVEHEQRTMPDAGAIVHGLAAAGDEGLQARQVGASRRVRRGGGRDVARRPKRHEGLRRIRVALHDQDRMRQRGRLAMVDVAWSGAWSRRFSNAAARWVRSLTGGGSKTSPNGAKSCAVRG
jgi:DNA-binding transcriptional LysR family regulator